MGTETEEKAETPKIQIIKIEKMAKLFEDLDINSVKFIVAIKEGSKPAVHLLAVPHSLVDKFEKFFQIAGIRMDYIQVIPDDFGELEQSQEVAKNVH